jgi:hypothetical protein
MQQGGMPTNLCGEDSNIAMSVSPAVFHRHMPAERCILHTHTMVLTMTARVTAVGTHAAAERQPDCTTVRSFVPLETALPSHSVVPQCLI